jgi:hypothetical protein
MIDLCPLPSAYQVPVPPVMTSPIALDIPENALGAFLPSVSSVTIDYQDLPLKFAIAFGNDAGIFGINASSGLLSVLPAGPGLSGALNFEAQSSYVLMVSATQIGGSALSSTAEVDVTG